jgi:hypothetical protein
MDLLVLSAAFALGGLVLHVYHLLRDRSRRGAAARGLLDRDSVSAPLPQAGLDGLHGELVFHQLQRQAMASREPVRLARMKFRADSVLAEMHAMRESLDAVTRARGGMADIHVQYLLGFIQTFERWHSDLETLYAFYVSAAKMNTDFTEVSCDLAIASQMVRIEAVKLGAEGERFLKSAAELVQLSARAHDVSQTFHKALRDGVLAGTASVQQLAKFEQYAGAVVAAR